MIYGTVDFCLSQPVVGPFTLTDPVPISSIQRLKLLSHGYRFVDHQSLLPLQSPLPDHSRLRILILTNLYPPQELGGYGRSIYDFAQNLSLLGHSIYVLTSDAPYLGGDLRQEQNVDRGLQLLGTYKDGVHFLSPGADFSRRCTHNLTLLESLLSSFRPQSVFVGNIDLLDPKLLNCILRRNIHCWHHQGFATSANPIHQLPIHSSFYHLLGGSHATSRSIAGELQISNSVPVIYTGACTQYFSDLPLIPMNASPLRIAYAGLMMASKGTQILIQALAQLRSMGIAFECNFAGGTLQDGGLQPFIKLVEHYHLQDSIKFLGFLERDKLREFYSKHQVFVFPSIHPEGFGIVQVEAMSAGLLVISSGEGGARETVHDDVSGRRFPAGDHLALAQVLYDVHQNTSYHEQLRRRGRQLASTHFDTASSSRKLSRLMVNASL